MEGEWGNTKYRADRVRKTEKLTLATLKASTGSQLEEAYLGFIDLESLAYLARVERESEK